MLKNSKVKGDKNENGRVASPVSVPKVKGVKNENGRVASPESVPILNNIELILRSFQQRAGNCETDFFSLIKYGTHLTVKILMYWDR